MPVVAKLEQMEHPVITDVVMAVVLEEKALLLMTEEMVVRQAAEVEVLVSEVALQQGRMVEMAQEEQSESIHGRR